MQFLLDTSARFGEEGGYQTIGDVFKNGGPTFLVGILVVFAVLSIIWGVIELFHFCSYTLPQKINKKRHPAPAFTPVPVRIATADETDSSEDSEEIVAVIAAAIEAAKAEKPTGEFRVVSFRRK